MKILLFPSDLGGGFGHISRCLALAQEGKRRGHECAFVINDRKYEKKLKDEFNVFITKEVNGWSSLSSVIRNYPFRKKSPAAPLFTVFTSLDYQVLRDRLISKKIIDSKLNHYEDITKTFKPDVLIGDTNLLVWMLSQRIEVPVVQIVRFASHPKTAQLIWWKSTPKGIFPPDSTALFNPLLNKMELEPIEKAEDLLKGDHYIVPSIPEVEPIPEDEQTTYVGELTISNKSCIIPSWFKEIDKPQPLVYITIGGGAGPVGNKSLFSTIIDAFGEMDVQVVVSTSSKFDLPDRSNVPKNIRFYKWVPGKLLISKADMVIFHGGYGTMMECITCGKPTLTLPFHSEQEGNGRRLEQLGSGRVIMLSKEEFKQIKGKWRYGFYNLLIQNRYDLSANELKMEVENILSNDAYAKKAKKLQNKIRHYCGAKKAMQLVEKYWA